MLRREEGEGGLGGGGLLALKHDSLRTVVLLMLWV